MATYDDRDPAARTALENISALFDCGVLLVSDDGQYRVRYCNEQLSVLFGCTHDEFCDLCPRLTDRVHPDDRAVTERAFTDAVSRGDSYRLLYRALRKDGSVMWIKETGSRVTAPGAPTMLLCTLLDVTGDDDARRALEQRSTADPMAQLLTEAEFRASADALFRHDDGRTHALLLIDVDRFARINETFGHAFGDKVLSGVVQTLRSVTRTGDLLGRFGGDEFVLLLKDVRNDDGFRRRVEHIRSLLHKPLPEENEISCGIGVALRGKHAADFDTLLLMAGAALRTAKAQGGNCVVF